MIGPLTGAVQPAAGYSRPQAMRAEVLTIGDELCRGEIVDTNSSHLAARLWDLAITTRWMTSCTDDAADIASALAQASDGLVPQVPLNWPTTCEEALTTGEPLLPPSMAPVTSRL